MTARPLVKDALPRLRLLATPRPLVRDPHAEARFALHALCIGWEDLPFSEAEKWSMAFRRAHPSIGSELVFLVNALREALAERERLDSDPHSLGFPLLERRLLAEKEAVERRLLAEKEAADEAVREALDVLVTGRRDV